MPSVSLPGPRSILSPCSRRSMTWPTPWIRCGQPARCSLTTGGSWSPTSGWQMPSPRTVTRWSGSCTAGASCTAYPPPSPGGPPRPPALSCAPPRLRAGLLRQGSPGSRFCPSTTASGASTSCAANLDSRTANRTLVGCRSPRSTSPVSGCWQRFGDCQADSGVGRVAARGSVEAPVVFSLDPRIVLRRWLVESGLDGRLAASSNGFGPRAGPGGSVPGRGTGWVPFALLGPSPVRVQRDHAYPSTAAATNGLGAKGLTLLEMAGRGDRWQFEDPS